MLHTLADHLEIVWGALLAASIVVLLTPAVGGMARLLGVVDRPEGRRLNRRTVPRLGGLALFFGVFVPALAFLDLSGEMRGVLLNLLGTYVHFVTSELRLPVALALLLGVILVRPSGLFGRKVVRRV